MLALLLLLLSICSPEFVQEWACHTQVFGFQTGHKYMINKRDVTSVSRVDAVFIYFKVVALFGSQIASLGLISAKISASLKPFT